MAGSASSTGGNSGGSCSFVGGESCFAKALEDGSKIVGKGVSAAEALDVIDGLKGARVSIVSRGFGRVRGGAMNGRIEAAANSFMGGVAVGSPEAASVKVIGRTRDD